MSDINFGKSNENNPFGNFPQASLDDIFQYNQKLEWFGTSTHEAIDSFLKSLNIAMFMPKSFEYELTAYIFNCLDWCLAHPNRSMLAFNLSRVQKKMNNTLEKKYENELVFLCKQWDKTCKDVVSYALELQDLCHLFKVTRHDKQKQEQQHQKQEQDKEQQQDDDQKTSNNEQVDDDIDEDEEKILDKMCQVFTLEFQAISEMIASGTIAALYMFMITRAFLVKLSHDNDFLNYLTTHVFNNSPDDDDDDDEIKWLEWYKNIICRIFKMDNQSSSSLYNIIGKQKIAPFVNEYYEAQTDEEKHAIIVKHGPLVHEDYFFGDYLLDIILFTMKKYEATSSSSAGLLEDDRNWISQLVCYTRPQTSTTNENDVTNEKNIISLLASIERTNNK